MRKEITREALYEVAKEVIAENGEDYIYERPVDSEVCLYARPEGWECIVGHMLGKLGHTFEDVYRWEGRGASTVFDHLGYTLDQNSQSFVDNLQAEQDAGNTWGYALSEAEHYIFR